MRRNRLEAGSASSRTDRRPYAVLDTETDGLRGALTYWTATCECRPDDVATGHDAVSLWRHVTGHSGRSHANRDHVWWAHNGGEYDYLYLIDPIRADVLAGDVLASPITRQTTTIGWRTTTGQNRTDLRDSYALLPDSLARLTASLAPAMPKGDIGLSAGVRFDPDNPTHSEYAAQDSRSLLAVLLTFRGILSDAFGGALPAWSAASTALRAWRQTLAPGEAYRPLPDPFAPLARAGYFGGIVHLGSTDWQGPCTTLDINAMYPSVMRDAGVPVGVPWAVAGEDRRRPGMYRVRVTVPEDAPFTFLGSRTPDGLAWPTGTFSTVLTSPEIAAARARGVRVSVQEGMVWPKIAHPFGRYVDQVEAMRRAGGAMSTVGKIMGNGLYGKFGSRPERDEWCLAATRPGPEWEPPPFDGMDPDAAAAHAGLWVRTGVPLHAPYLLPHWAAWITAGARLRLLGLAEAVGDVVYTDTDSVTAPTASVEAAIAAGRVTVGAAFGACKVERRWSRFRALGPKVAQGVNADACRADGRKCSDGYEDCPGGIVGHPIYKAKGIPRRQASAAFDPGRPAIGWDSPNGSLSVLRGGPMTTPRTRRLSTLDHSIAWRMTPNGVRPVHMDERPS